MEEFIEIGGTYLFHGRMIYLGEVVAITLFDIVLKRVCWMAHMGSGEEARMHKILKNGIISSTEIECAPPDHLVAIPRGSFARFPWEHPLPKKSQ